MGGNDLYHHPIRGWYTYFGKTLGNSEVLGTKAMICGRWRTKLIGKLHVYSSNVHKDFSGVKAALYNV